MLARGLYRKDRQEPRIRVSSIKKDMSDAPWRGLQTYHTREDYKEEIYADIEHAMVRLDELCEGNDFHRGDKMRINEVRAVLKRIKEELLRQQ